MSRAVEVATGAQILPPVGDGRRTMTGWEAHCAADADLRHRHPALRDVAGRLIVVPDETRENV